jgi:hypothetical protein
MVHSDDVMFSQELPVLGQHLDAIGIVEALVLPCIYIII